MTGSAATHPSVPAPVEVTVRVDPSLHFLLSRHLLPGSPQAHTICVTGPAICVYGDATSTLGHLVQSMGLPLTEVGVLMVDGSPAHAAQRLIPGDVIDVLAVGRPQAAPTDPPRFLLDVHLGRLARRLRFLGIDCAYHRHAEDPDLTVEAARDRRVLLTRDLGLLKRRHLPGRPLPRPGDTGPVPWSAAYVRGRTTQEQLDDVLSRFAPPLAPWTRCPSCNGALAAVIKSDVEHLLEPGTRRQFEEFACCRGCGQVYWRGAHAEPLDAFVAVTMDRSGAR